MSRASSLQTSCASVSMQRVRAYAGINFVGVDSTLYDQILDMSCTLGLIPERFQQLKGLALYFAMARGHKDAPALDMSKYFNTNYHYLVRYLPSSTAQ
jgi:5-methyltetrahydropteroyltriglutamate--homocysteine methyltransferase